MYGSTPPPQGYTQKDRDFSCFLFLTNPLYVHLWKLATFPDCTFTWQTSSVFVELGGATYYISFIRYLVGSVITNRDNQSLQQLLRLGVRWVGGNFFALRQNLPLTPTHSETSFTCAHTNSAGQPLKTNVVRRFFHSG